MYELLYTCLSVCARADLRLVLRRASSETRPRARKVFKSRSSAGAEAQDRCRTSTSNIYVQGFVCSSAGIQRAHNGILRYTTTVVQTAARYIQLCSADARCSSCLPHGVDPRRNPELRRRRKIEGRKMRNIQFSHVRGPHDGKHGVTNLRKR